MWTKGGCIGFKPKQYRNVNDSMRSRVGAGEGEGEVRTTFFIYTINNNQFCDHPPGAFIPVFEQKFTTFI